MDSSMSVSSLYGGQPENGLTTLDGDSVITVTITSLKLLATVLLHSDKYAVHIHPYESTLLTFAALSPRTPKTLPAKLLSILLVPSQYYSHTIYRRCY